MNHSIRWAIEKITQRLGLIEPLAYRPGLHCRISVTSRFRPTWPSRYR